MVNQLKKDLPESQKSPFPLQTDVIPHHSRQRLPHPAISERAWFHPSSSKPYRSLSTPSMDAEQNIPHPAHIPSRFRSIHLSGILDVKAYRNPASPVFSTLRLLYSKLLYDSPYPKG